MRKQISVASGIMRWVRGEGLAIETLRMEAKAKAHLSGCIRKKTLANYER